MEKPKAWILQIPIKKTINLISLYRMDDITMETNRILDDLLNTARGVDKEWV